MGQLCNVIPPPDVKDKQSITSTNCNVIVGDCTRVGDVVTVNCIFAVPSGLSGNPTVLTLPWKVKSRCDFIALDFSLSTSKLMISIAPDTDNFIVNMGGSTIPSGTFLLTGTYITSD